MGWFISTPQPLLVGVHERSLRLMVVLREISRVSPLRQCRGRQRFLGRAPCGVVEVDDDVKVDKDSGGEPLALL
jgi:hypothetical protein